MPKREVLQSITIGRGKVQDGVDPRTQKPIYISKERIKLRPGQVFDFTDEEIEYLERVAPNAITSKVTVDLDDPDAVKKLDASLSSIETSPPGVSGQGGGSGDEM
jgi:hypothetical protein